MTAAQIVAELRRAALCKDDPYDCDYPAFEQAMDFKISGQIIGPMPDPDWRIFYLLVAEALEQA